FYFSYIVIFIFIFSLFFFFFSSRRRHTRSKRDWSSDVCSSDLLHRPAGRRVHGGGLGGRDRDAPSAGLHLYQRPRDAGGRAGGPEAVFLRLFLHGVPVRGAVL